MQAVLEDRSFRINICLAVIVVFLTVMLGALSVKSASHSSAYAMNSSQLVEIEGTGSGADALMIVGAALVVVGLVCVTGGIAGAVVAAFGGAAISSSAIGTLVGGGLAAMTVGGAAQQVGAYSESHWGW